MKLVGKRLAQTPTRKTIDNIVTEKVVASNIQVGRELEKKERTTLYSDETRKFGKTYNSYFISDQNKNVYMLGLREMNNKAASTTLDTFKEILSDISDLCDDNLENNKLSSGYHILCNIRDFMSDRAKTNIAFTQLLIDYRKDIMPDVIDGWNDFTEEQKNACSKINNFFVAFIFLLILLNVHLLPLRNLMHYTKIKAKVMLLVNLKMNFKLMREMKYFCLNLMAKY